MDVKLFSGKYSSYLAEKISDYYGYSLGKWDLLRFSDGEMQPVIEESVRGSYVFFIQSTAAPADNLMELLLLIDTARRASADYITAVIPYFGYARQDRKDKPRVPLSAKLIANLIESVIFASPDVGGVKRARNYANHFQCDLVICDKYRRRANEVAGMTVIGDVQGKDVILVDDLADTAGTLCKAADALVQKGAKSVRAICTHPVLSGKAYENIEASQLTELIVTDTIPLRRTSPKIKVLSSAKLFAHAIRNTHEHRSISALFLGD